MDGQDKIDEYRQPWESDEHWTLRKEFIEKFKEDFSEDRLLCLAQVYSNVELLGCSYPAPVMHQIRELGKDLEECKELRGKRKERAAVLFVKSNEKSSKNSGVNLGKRLNNNTQNETAGSKGGGYWGAFGCSTNLFGNSGKVKENNVSDKDKSPLISKTLDLGNSASNEDIKNTSSRVASKSDVTAIETASKTESEPKYLTKINADALLYMRGLVVKQAHPVEILHNASQKFGLKLQYHSKEVKTPIIRHECRLEIDGEMLSEAKELTKKKARLVVSELAIDKLMGSQINICNESNTSENTSSNTSSNTSNAHHIDRHDLNQFPVSNSSSAGHLNTIYPSKFSGSQQSNNHFSSKRENKVSSLNASNCNVYKNQMASSDCRNRGMMNSSRFAVSAQKRVFPSKHVREEFKRKKKTDILVILDNSDITKTDNPCSILMTSASFNGVQLQFEYETHESPKGTISTKAIILKGEDVLSSVLCENKQLAKEAASRVALELLRKTAYTVKVKDEHEGGVTISRSQVFDTAESNTSLTENNIGCKMLKMMGWAGGGIGATGNKGIQEPVKATEKHKFGQGLGYTQKDNAEVSFTSRIEQILQDYAKSDTTSDLIFSTEFSKEERKEIHRIADKYNLKNHSTGGKGEGRHCLIGKRFQPEVLIQRLMDAGGCTHKYELIPPTG